MGNTGVITNFKKQLWEKELLKEALEEMWFKQFMSTNGKSPIYLKADFQKEKGNRITVGLRMKLSGEGVDGDAELEGNEEELSVYDQTVYIDQKRNAVRLKGRMDEKSSAYNLRTEAKDGLAGWIAEIMEKECFRKLGGIVAYTFSNTPTVPSTNRVVYGGDASSDSDIDSSDKMTLSLIFKLKAKAQTVTPKIQPIRYQGKDYYVLIIHPRQKFDLTQDSDYTTFMKDAEVRGKDNPLIAGADAVVDNVIIHVHNFVPTLSVGAGSALAGARALLLGNQALVLGIGDAGAGWNEKEFDFGNKWAIACGRVFGLQKSKFNSEDFGVIAVDTFISTI
jgi:N4-gp56 family major capsid protein